MENDETRVNGVCRLCGCKEALAAADATAVGLLEEFLDGIYSCCQVVQWADEQWLAWAEAGQDDGKAPDEIMATLEVQSDPLLVSVHARKPRSATETHL